MILLAVKKAPVHTPRVFFVLQNFVLQKAQAQKHKRKNTR